MCVKPKDSAHIKRNKRPLCIFFTTKIRQPLVGQHAAENYLKPSILPFCSSSELTSPYLTILPDPAILQSDSQVTCRVLPTGHKMPPATPRHKVFPLILRVFPERMGPTKQRSKGQKSRACLHSPKNPKNHDFCSEDHAKMLKIDTEINTILNIYEMLGLRHLWHQMFAFEALNAQV